MKPNDITVIMTWYGQQDHLLNQMLFYAEMAEKYHIKPKVIIMNDANAPERQYFHECINAYKGIIDVQGVDVKTDIGFNSHTCRNLGVKLAKTDWVWLIDVDCFEQEEIFHYLRFEKELDENWFYVPRADMDYPENMGDYELLDPKGIIKYVTHPNSWLMTKECFWSTGGYDIEFCGVRQGDAEFFISIGREGHKTWDYELLHDEFQIRVTFPKRDPFYIRQDSWKQNDARELIDFVRTRNQNPYRRYRKRIHDLTWEYV